MSPATFWKNLQHWKQLEEQAFHHPELQDIPSYNTIVYINEYVANIETYVDVRFWI